jgi:WD40 repeat protein
MFIATCGFDKIIRILDFFSGEVVGEVGGHSELITGIKFSPDGKYLVTVSGDGCILQWKLGGLLRSAMKERMLELYAIAKRKQEKADAPPPPPLPPSASAASRHASRDNDSQATQTAPSAAILPPPPPVSEQNIVKSARNRWQARVRDQGGYEIFGKKVNVQSKTIMSASCDGFIQSPTSSSSSSSSLGNGTSGNDNDGNSSIDFRASTGGAKKGLNQFTLEMTGAAATGGAFSVSRSTSLTLTLTDPNPNPKP